MTPLGGLSAADRVRAFREDPEGVLAEWAARRKEELERKKNKEKEKERQVEEKKKDEDQRKHSQVMQSHEQQDPT